MGGKLNNSIAGQFAARKIDMLELPAYRILSLSAHRVISRIEIEYARHGGKDNGKLPVTFNDFEAYGVRRHSIRPAIDELEALGLIEVTDHGARSIRAEYPKPKKFRLTYRHVDGRPGDGTHEWQRFKTTEDAVAAVKAAHERREKAKAARLRNPKAASAETAPIAVPKRHRRSKVASAETSLQGNGRNVTTIYISEQKGVPALSDGDAAAAA